MTNHTSTAFDEAHGALRDFLDVKTLGTGWLTKHILVLVGIAVAIVLCAYFLRDIIRFLTVAPLVLAFLDYAIFASLLYAFHWRHAYEQLEGSHRRLQKAITHLSPEQREALLGPATDEVLVDSRPPHVDASHG